MPLTPAEIALQYLSTAMLPSSAQDPAPAGLSLALFSARQVVKKLEMSKTCFQTMVGPL